LRDRRLHRRLVDVFLDSPYLRNELRTDLLDDFRESTPTVNAGDGGRLFPGAPPVVSVGEGPRRLDLVRQWLACRIVREELSLASRGSGRCALPGVKAALRLTREGMTAEPGQRPARERARAAEMAFLWVWLPEALRAETLWLQVAGVVCSVADRHYALPVLLDSVRRPGSAAHPSADLGVLALSGDQAVVYGLAQSMRDELRNTFQRGTAKEEASKIAIGVAYVPHADISGCKCLLGAAFIAAAGVDPGCQYAISFFDRAKHAEVARRLKGGQPLGP
jgi:hypothetical protein